jgi:hypothetical protein
MGHYRSEMGYEAEDAAREKRKQKRQTKMVAYIKKDIKERGIERVLADILDDPSFYKIGIALLDHYQHEAAMQDRNDT